MRSLEKRTLSSVSPFQTFRYWLRRAPVSERVIAGVATVVVLALLSWLLIPESTHSEKVSSAAASSAIGGSGSGAASESGPAAGALSAPSAEAGAASASPGAAGSPTAASGATGTSGTGGTGATPAVGGPVPMPAAGAKGCVSPPGSAPGITATEIKVGIALVNIVGPAANSLFGIPTPAQQQADYDAAIAATNAEGGVACRNLVPQYFEVNAADQSDRQQKCLDIVASGVYAVIDGGSYATFPEKVCFGQHQLPYFGQYFLVQSERDKFYPYLFNLNLLDALEKDLVFGLKDKGFFDPAKGFKKFGMVYHDCYPDLIAKVNGWLQQAGISGSTLVTYNLGCPATFASPSDIQQAVLKFRQNNVTHVTAINMVGDLANFTNVAEQQRYRPKYGLPDEAMISIAYGTMRPNYNNIAGALAIASSRSGEERTPGYVPSAATVKCNAAYKARGLASVYEQPAFAGNVCDEVWMLKAALDNAPSVARSALAAGLQRAKSIDFSFPQAPNDLTGARATTGGQFWRTAEFRSSCSCWQVLDRDFRRSF